MLVKDGAEIDGVIGLGAERSQKQSNSSGQLDANVERDHPHDLELLSQATNRGVFRNSKRTKVVKDEANQTFGRKVSFFKSRVKIEMSSLI